MTMHLPEIEIAGKEVFEVFGVTVTNTWLWAIIISAVIFIFSFLSLRQRKLIPGGLQNLWEFLLESLFNFYNSIVGDAKKTKEIFPLAGTIFILVWFCNLLELIPGVGVIHFLRAPSSDLNFTFALALFSIIYINILALKNLGLGTYLKKFFNKNPILLFVGSLEAMGELTRILSLGFRLFGNLFAGEILLMVVSYLFAYLLPLPFLALEILVGVIQAFIFSSLIVIFYATSTQHGENHA
jgi:F-type H+-transporting ATPase subunit a